MAACSGIWRHKAAKEGIRFDSEPGRARLKLMHQQVHKVLSVHLFFGALCRNMWCTNILVLAGFIELFRCIDAGRTI
ncbi:MAG: hypothetical protein CL828_01945 [Crocinitomicaceae bacterium]|nr:hypothetical protein [Crocinitomicaceae bacterium]